MTQESREAQLQPIEAVVKALAILNLFSASSPELGVSEISRKTGMHKSTVFHSLASLEVGGLLVKDERTRRYTVGPKALNLAGAYLSTVDLRGKSNPIMERLRAQTRETVSLYLPSGDHCICLERLEGSQSVRRVIKVGDRVPLNLGSTGKILLAYLSARARATLLARIQVESFAHWGVTDQQSLEAKLASIREEGVAVTLGEHTPQASSISAPIFDSAGEMIAAITLAGPTARFEGNNVSTYSQLVKQAAMDVSMQAGYSMYMDLHPSATNRTDEAAATAMGQP